MQRNVCCLQPSEAMQGADCGVQLATSRLLGALVNLVVVQPGALVGLQQMGALEANGLTSEVSPKTWWDKCAAPKKLASSMPTLFQGVERTLSEAGCASLEPGNSILSNFWRGAPQNGRLESMSFACFLFGTDDCLQGS